MRLQVEPTAQAAPSIPQRMRALSKTKPTAGLELVEVPVPEAGSGEALVRVLRAGICGTDLHIYRWDAWASSRVALGRVIGHEFCGIVTALGPGTTGVRIGELVAVECHVACGACPICRAGSAHVCPRMQVIGVDRNGGFADYVAVPVQNLWPIPPGIEPEVAAILDPVGNAVHAALSTELVARTVAVIGCGPIGLLAIGVARRCGAYRIFASDIRPQRLDLARVMGADVVLDARTTPVADRIREMTAGLGADVVFEMSGSPEGIRTGLRALRNGGFLALLGLPAGEVLVDLVNDVIFKEATVRGIFGRRLWETWELATRLVEGGLHVRSVITHRFPLERYEEAFQILERGEGGKVILEVAP